jgi:hypothetical protein
MRSDIAVVGEFGEPILLVELKNKTGTSKDWAAKFRRNLAAHGFLPKAPFFLIATPDHFYLWKNPGSSTQELDPDFEIEPGSPLFTPGEKIGPFEFETKVALWLNRIMNSEADQTNGAVGELLSVSGLREAIQGGKLAFENEP